MMICSEGRLLLFQIGRSIERQKLSGQINPVQRCKDYLEKNYKEEISLETVAGEFHFNPSYLSTLFKQSFGTSFSEYLSEVRMRKALDLLLHSDCRVKQIAGMVGYKDSNYFIRSFKKKYKVTPDEFRKKREKQRTAERRRRDMKKLYKQWKYARLRTWLIVFFLCFPLFPWACWES